MLTSLYPNLVRDARKELQSLINNNDEYDKIMFTVTVG